MLGLCKGIALFSYKILLGLTDSLDWKGYKFKVKTWRAGSVVKMQTAIKAYYHYIW